MFHIPLDCRVVKLPSYESLGIKDGVGRVHGDLVLGRVPDQPLGVGEGDVGRGRPVALIVGDDLHLSVLEHADAGVRGAEVDADGGLLGHDDVVLVSVEGGRGGVVQGVGVCLDAWAGLSGVEAGAAYRPPVEPPRTFDEPRRAG